MKGDVSRRKAMLGLAAMASAAASATQSAKAQTTIKIGGQQQTFMAQQTGEGALSYLSEEEAKTVLRMWRNYIKFYIGESGEMLAGWGYPQSVPHMNTELHRSLSTGNIKLEDALRSLNGIIPAQGVKISN